MPALVVDITNAFKNALLQREAAQMAEAARRWLLIESALQGQVDALALELAQKPGRVTRGQLLRSQRYRALRRQIDDELRRFSDFMEVSVTEGQRAMAAAALEHSATTIRAVAAEARVATNFNRLPVSAVENLIGMAGDGLPLRTLLDEAGKGAGDRLAQQLVNGIALGRGPVEVARQAVPARFGNELYQDANRRED